jgi:site-specific recombinase XerD
VRPHQGWSHIIVPPREGVQEGLGARGDLLNNWTSQGLHAAFAGADAKFGFKAHPHMLRHACGYALANKGHDTRALQAYLGHRNIQHTVRYAELSPTRFKDFWRS